MDLISLEGSVAMAWRTAAKYSHQEFQTGPTGNETPIELPPLIAFLGLRAIDDLYQKV